MRGSLQKPAVHSFSRLPKKVYLPFEALSFLLVKQLASAHRLLLSPYHNNILTVRRFAPTHRSTPYRCYLLFFPKIVRSTSIHTSAAAAASHNYTPVSSRRLWPHVGRFRSLLLSFFPTVIRPIGIATSTAASATTLSHHPEHIIATSGTAITPTFTPASAASLPHYNVNQHCYLLLPSSPPP